MDGEFDFVWIGFVFFDVQENMVVDYEFGEFFYIGFGGFVGGDYFVMVYDGDFVGDGYDFVQFVCDQNDSFFLIFELGEDVEQVIGFGWCQYVGWFVEDQDIGFVVDGFEDFDVLLYVDWKFFDDCIGIDFYFVLFFELFEFGVCFGDVFGQDCVFFGVQYDVFQYGEIFDEYEMLVDYVDVGGDCSFGIFDIDFLVGNKNFVIIGLIEVIKNGY